MNKYQENLEALDNARLTINGLCGRWLPREVLDNLEEYGDYEIYNYVKYSVFKELVDKETPMKVKMKKFDNEEYGVYCPKCNSGLSFHWKMKYCPSCGQHLDWSEE